jgi:transforming growth factor-beta-induced protein
MKRVLGLFLVLSFLFITFTPVSAQPTDDIVDIAVGNDSFTILVAALTEANLVETLQGEGPFTVFAPTDEAFADLLSALNISAADLLASPRLREVLLYHVVSGKVMSTDLSDGMSAATILGESITVDLSSGVMINDSNVIAADIEATNGVIHVIDKVLVPAAFFVEFDTVVDIALSSPDFSILVAALQRANLVDALLADGPFTVFAPTNAAFEALLADLGVSADDLLAQSGLADVLLAHVVSGKVMSTDLTQGLQAPTLNSAASLTFGLNPVTINGDIAVVAADLEALNGVVHVIDRVIVPSNFTLDATEAPAEAANDNTLISIILGVLVIAGVGFITFSNNRSQ